MHARPPCLFLIYIGGTIESPSPSPGLAKAEETKPTASTPFEQQTPKNCNSPGQVKFFHLLEHLQISINESEEWKTQTRRTAFLYMFQRCTLMLRSRIMNIQQETLTFGLRVCRSRFGDLIRPFCCRSLGGVCVKA